MRRKALGSTLPKLTASPLQLDVKKLLRYHNHQNYFERCLNTVIFQTFKPKTKENIDEGILVQSLPGKSKKEHWC